MGARSLAELHYLGSTIGNAKNHELLNFKFKIPLRHSIRLTFLSPSLLTAHLSQATLVVSSVPQLSQLLLDEVEACLLQRICELGQQLCSDIGGTWFTDLNRCVARWEGCVL